MAPIFDSGNAMFWQNPKLSEYDNLTAVEVNSFRKTEKQLLGYVRDRGQLDLTKLPTEDELRNIYAKDSLIPCVHSVLLGYRKKIDLLEKI